MGAVTGLVFPDHVVLISGSLVDPGVATLIRGGSIPYPRVSSTSPTLLFTVPENEPITRSHPPPPPPPPDVLKAPLSASRSAGTKSRTPSRSLKDETVISRYGSLVFHNYCPSSAASSNSPSLRINDSVIGATHNITERLPKHRAREVQQAELLHLEDAAQAHRRLGQEICQMKGRPPHKIAQSTQLNSVFQQIVLAQPSEQSSPQQCFVFSSPAHSLHQALVPPPPSSVSPPPPPPPPAPPPPPIPRKFSTQLFPTSHIFGNGSATVLTLNNGRSMADAVTQQIHSQPRQQQQQQHRVLGLAPAASLLTTARSGSSTESVGKVASLEEIESVWLDLRRLQQDITEEASRIGLNIYSSDGFPGAFTVATSSEVEPNHPTCQRLNQLVKEHANLCSLARLLISDRLEFLDETDLFLLHRERPVEKDKETLDDSIDVSCNSSLPVDTQKKSVGSELERSLLQSYLCRLGGNYYQRGAARARRARQLSYLASSGTPLSSDPIGVSSNTALLQTFWRNSTILPAHSENIFYQQQTSQPVSQKMNGNIVKLPSATEAWMDQLCTSTAIQTTFNPVSSSPSTATVASVPAPILHTTSSMPANLHLVNAPATMVLSSAMTDPFFPAPPTASVTNAASASNGGQGEVAVFLPSTSGSSSSSGPVLTAEGSSCSIPTSSNGQIAEPTRDTLMAMEFSPTDLNDIPSPPRAETHDISDVQDFLSAFPLDEEVMGFGAASPVIPSTTTVTSFDSELSSDPHLFVPPDADLLWRQGLMDIS
ncbi:unnamed protein product [Hydatigera taeniaeformis]|uniref:Rho guanine nucleotide exchange factor 18 n=1 Tax=Hydatigena taeniaeformis TaxID=6205 RepID=A0A158RDI9_HYDTA|nr:unnamed protein product [Hydatigera taeniaeformis]